MQDSISIHLQLKKLNLWLEEYEIDSIKSHLQLAEQSINELGTTPHHSAIELLLVQSKYQMLLGDYKMASRYGTSAVGQSSTLGDTSLLIRTYDCLARASYYLRNYITTDSLCYLSLDLLEEQAKDVDENTASIYSLLGLSHFRRWETDRAIELHEKALSINRRVFGDIHSKVARDYGNLANCYRDKSDYFRAIEYLQSTAVILKNIYGPEHQNLATTYYNLAMNYDNVEESDTSIVYYYKAMDIRKKQFPADHVYFGEYWEGIARNYADLQQFDTALFYYKKAESIYETKDLDQYNASGFRAKVGYVYFRMGKSKEAMSQYNSALEVRRKDYGERDAQVMFYRMMLGGINSSQGKFHEGQLWYNRALEPFDFNTSEKSYGEIPNLTNLLLTLRDKAFSNYEWYLQDKNNAHLDTAFSASQQALALLDYLRSGYREDESRLLLNQQYKNVIDQSLEIIHMLFEVTGQEKYLDFFFQSLERKKATSMLVQLTERNFEQHKNLPASLITEEQRLKTLLNQLEISQRKSLTEGNDSLHTIVQHHLFDTRRTYDKFVNSLATNAPSYYNLKFQSNFPSLSTFNKF